MIETIKKTMGLILLFAGLASAPALQAADGSLSVSPAVLELRGQVGQSTTQTLTFTNGTSRSLSFQMRAYDAVVRDGKRVLVEAGTLPGSIAATAAFRPRLFTVIPGQSVKIDVTVTIPPRPAVRAIAVMCDGTTKLGQSPLRTTASIGTLLTFAIAGDVLAAEASALRVDPPTASSNLIASQQVVNSGTEPMVASGMLAIINRAGALVARRAIPSWRMLPGEKIDLRVEYGGELPSGSYRALVTYDLINRTLTSSADFNVR
jgi:hypothetical protein